MYAYAEISVDNFLSECMITSWYMQASTKPLVAASTIGYEAVVQLLLENNADINVMDQVSH